MEEKRADLCGASSPVAVVMALVLGEFLKAGTRLNSGRPVIGETRRAVKRSGGYVRVVRVFGAQVLVVQDGSRHSERSTNRCADTARSRR